MAWGQKGHDVTAYIAEQHFTPATAEAVADILDGMSPVYWANWLDNASHTPEYAYPRPGTIKMLMPTRPIGLSPNRPVATS